MSILWRKQEQGIDYQVRSAGNTRRLYTNGVFHSQYNPTRPLTGGVWDLLMLPAFFQPEAMRRILVLGVGGGAVIRQLQHFLGSPRFVGIELNPVHLYVARRFFGIDEALVQLYRADAIQWLADYRGRPFDMIIDDVFGESNGEPVKAAEANAKWFKCLHDNLTSHGVISMNFISSRDLRNSAFFSSAGVAACFPSAFQLTTPLHENVVGVFSRTSTDSRVLRENLSKIPGLNPRNKTCRLRYHIRRLAS